MEEQELEKLRKEYFNTKKDKEEQERLQLTKKKEEIISDFLSRPKVYGWDRDEIFRECIDKLLIYTDLNQVISFYYQTIGVTPISGYKGYYNFYKKETRSGILENFKELLTFLRAKKAEAEESQDSFFLEEEMWTEDIEVEEEIVGKHKTHINVKVNSIHNDYL